ncbi:MAG: leucine-rich repeat protein [Clostridia bacterium]|nr:leucine-rich repeat protein [Clostridia bacterium]
MKKILSLVFCFLLCVSILPVFAEGATSGVCGADLTWNFENGTLTLTGSGDTYDYSAEEEYSVNPPPWFDLREEITQIILPEGLTRIGDFALVGCIQMKTVKLPSTLISIGERAMMD